MFNIVNDLLRHDAARQESITNDVYGRHKRTWRVMGQCTKAQQIMFDVISDGCET